MIVRNGAGYTQRLRRPVRRGARVGMGDETVTFPYVDSSDTVAVPAPQPSGPGAGQQWFDLLKSVVPAGMTTLQEAVAQPGQVIKTPTTLITGPNTNIASIPGLSTASSGSLLIIGALVLGGLFLFAKKA